MDHIVQFAIGIDDEAIRKRIEENAYSDVISNLMAEAKKSLKLSKKYPSYSSDISSESLVWEYLVRGALSKFVSENKDVVIEQAAKYLADSYKRTKVFKEKMDATVPSSKGE